LDGSEAAFPDLRATVRVTVVGLGQAGLVSAACLAEAGHEVVGVETSEERRRLIERGRAPFAEPGLNDVLSRHIGDALQVTADLQAAVKASEVSLIAVGTPFDGEQIDLSQVDDVVQEIGAALRGTPTYHVVAVKSTVVPGTTDGRVANLLAVSSGKKIGAEIGLCVNPEFLREGSAVADFMNPDRIVVGGVDERSVQVLRELYGGFPNAPLVETNCRTAEMMKYASNAFLATLISFTNELANLCSDIGDLDIVDVMSALHLDRRLSPRLTSGDIVKPGILSYLAAGCGFGGSCLPKDVRSLVALGQAMDQDMSLLKAVMSVNDRQYARVLGLLERHFPEFTGVRIAVLGLAFKPDTDDLRESVALPIIRELRDRAASVVVFDPAAAPKGREAFGEDEVLFASSLVECLEDVDAVLVLTAWRDFSSLSSVLTEMERAPIVVDGRRALDKNEFEFYEGIGL